MLQATLAGHASRFALLLHHSDSKREWADHRQSRIGFLNQGLAGAKAQGWTVVDSKRDPDQQQSSARLGSATAKPLEWYK
jgi:hypothetical protein